MSKHSKWAKIKRKKGVADVKKGASFTKLLKTITVAVREGGGTDPASNFKLRLAVDAARAENVPKENIERAIERGSGKSGANAMESVLYEGFGPGGVAIMVEALTDNGNRTVHEVKKIFSDHGGTMGGPGAVAWGFARNGVVRLDTTKTAITPDTELVLIDAGAEDLRTEEDVTTVLCPMGNLERVKTAADQHALTTLEATIEWTPTTLAPALPASDQEKLLELLDALEEHDDVLAVATNAAFG